MSVGSYPSWNDIGVAYPSLMVTNGVAEMWYSGISYDNGQYDSARVGYAVSINGIDWIEYQGNPVLYNQGNTSCFGAVDVFFDDAANEYKMYYEDYWTYDTINHNKVNAIFMQQHPAMCFFLLTALQVLLMIQLFLMVMQYNLMQAVAYRTVGIRLKA